MFSGVNSNLQENFSTKISVANDNKIMTMSSVSHYNKYDPSKFDDSQQRRSGFNQTMMMNTPDGKMIHTKVVGQHAKTPN